MWNKEKQHAYNIKYRLENKDRIKQIQDSYYSKYRLVRIKKARAWYLKNQVKALMTRQAYRNTPLGRLNSIKSSAKTRRIDYSINNDDALFILSLSCHFCGSKKEQVGIDRLDNSLSYFKENCVACCQMCNYMKNTYSKEEFIQQCKLIHLHNS